MLFWGWFPRFTIISLRPLPQRFQLKPVTAGLPLPLTHLTAVCWACEQGHVCGFRLTISSAATYGKKCSKPPLRFVRNISLTRAKDKTCLCHTLEQNDLKPSLRFATKRSSLHVSYRPQNRGRFLFSFLQLPRLMLKFRNVWQVHFTAIVSIKTACVVHQLTSSE